MTDRDDHFDTLAPAFKVRVNGADLPLDAVADITAVTVVDDADAASMCALELNGWDSAKMQVKWMDDDLFAEGGPIEIEMGYVGRTSRLFSGEIVGLEPEFPQGSPPTLLVRSYDVRHRLMRENHTHSFLDSKDSDIVSQVAQSAGLKAKVEDSGVTFPYLLQHNQTDFQFLRHRAARIGWELAIDDRTIVFRKRPTDGDAVVTLRREVELMQFRPRLSTMNTAANREVRGWSAKDKKEVVGKAAVGEEGALMGGSTSGGSVARRAFPKSGTTVVDRPLQNEAEADQLAQLGYREMSRDYVRAEGLCIGDPRLRSGTVVRIDGIGKRFSGLYYVSMAEHRFSRKTGYRTRFTATRNAT